VSYPRSILLQLKEPGPIGLASKVGSLNWVLDRFGGQSISVVPVDFHAGPFWLCPNVPVINFVYVVIMLGYRLGPGFRTDREAPALHTLGPLLSGTPFMNETPRCPKCGQQVKLVASLPAEGGFAAVFARTRDAHLEHEQAKNELKGLMPHDAKEATGHGLGAKRSKSGAVSFDLLSIEGGHAPVQ
jgi:hypothetical protein